MTPQSFLIVIPVGRPAARRVARNNEQEGASLARARLMAAARASESL